MNDVNKLKDEYCLYHDILTIIYEIKDINNNIDLINEIEYIKGIKTGLTIAINKIS